MKKLAAAKTKSTKTTTAAPALEHITGLTPEENEQFRERRAQEARAKAAVARAVAAHDAVSLFTLADVGEYLRDIEQAIVKAVGLLGVAIHDPAGIGDDDIEEAIRALADGRGCLLAVRNTLESAGALAEAGVIAPIAVRP